MIGCCVLTPLNERTVQLRQMAVDLSLQGKGIGALILQFAEKLAVERGFTNLILHARDAVMKFYGKSGYEQFDEPFTEVGVPHHKMQKQLVKTG